jgi:hypothetical protein
MPRPTSASGERMTPNNTMPMIAPRLCAMT